MKIDSKYSRHFIYYSLFGILLLIVTPSFMGFAIKNFVIGEYLFFMLTTYMFHLVFEKVNSNKSKNFVMLYLATTMGKMLFYIICLVIYTFFIDRLNARDFIIYFFIFYLYFYVFEFRFMVKANK